MTMVLMITSTMNTNSPPITMIYCTCVGPRDETCKVGVIVAVMGGELEGGVTVMGGRMV